jgi:hypothetical protein
LILLPANAALYERILLFIQAATGTEIHRNGWILIYHVMDDFPKVVEASTCIFHGDNSYISLSLLESSVNIEGSGQSLRDSS